ncbi:MAG: hypothetical protein R3288_11240, partial [Woeseiaceae bacterium]|nr:hypothetical protein [Woeseiaceae bacterium]
MQRRAATSMSLTSALLILYSMPVIADEHEGDGAVATPIEIYTCNYADGKTQKDFDAVTAKFNAWADDAGMTEYSAWQLMPFYSSPTQDFDFVWLGASPSAQSMGRDQDKWFATGGKIAEEFEKVTPCHTHANFAALEFKEPPERTTHEDRNHGSPPIR